MHGTFFDRRLSSPFYPFLCALFMLHLYAISATFYGEMRSNLNEKFKQMTRRDGGHGGNGNFMETRQQQAKPYFNDKAAMNHYQQSTMNYKYIRQPNRGYVEEYSKPMMNRRYDQPKYPVNAAVKSKFTVEYIDVPYTPPNDAEPNVIQIESKGPLVILQFKSQSSPIQVQQLHVPALPGEVTESKSEDEPKLLKHIINKPIIQEIREYIRPYRKVIQEILPVVESINTIVSRTKNEPEKYVSERNPPGNYGDQVYSGSMKTSASARLNDS